MIKFLDLHGQYLRLQPAIDAAIAGVIRETSFIGGPAIAAFEREFARYQQAAECVGVANGTDAIEIVLEALALPKGSEVIVPANSFIASAESVTRAGFRVVFADVDEGTGLLDPADVRRRVTPATSAIIAVHLYGQPCDMDGLAAVARDHGLRLIEDAAQAHGAEYRGRRVGALADAGTFSFYPGKNLGAYGDAGAIVTNDAALARQCRMIANHGRVEKYNHEFEGRNSRLDTVQAAILGAKLPHLDGWVEQRNRIAAAYLEGLRDVTGLELPVVRPEVRHAFHLFVVRTPHRDRLLQHLTARQIQTGIHYPIALPQLRAYAYLNQAGDTPVSTRLSAEVLSLPIGEHLTVDDVAQVCAAIRQRDWR